MVAVVTVALTGATGFVGGHVLSQLHRQGLAARALTRREQPAREGVEWVEGALDQPDSLRRLVEGAEAVIHVAGVINAVDAAGFEAGNVAGTLAMLAAATAAGTPRWPSPRTCARCWLPT